MRGPFRALPLDLSQDYRFRKKLRRLMFIKRGWSYRVVITPMCFGLSSISFNMINFRSPISRTAFDSSQLSVLELRHSLRDFLRSPAAKE